MRAWACVSIKISVPVVKNCRLQVEAMLVAAGVAQPAKINMIDKFFPHAHVVHKAANTLGGGLPGHSTDAHGSIQKYLHDPRSIATLVCVHYHARVTIWSVYIDMRVPHFSWCTSAHCCHVSKWVSNLICLVSVN
jgi:hypothetical protein